MDRGDGSRMLERTVVSLLRNYSYSTGDAGDNYTPLQFIKNNPQAGENEFLIDFFFREHLADYIASALARDRNGSTMAWIGDGKLDLIPSSDSLAKNVFTRALDSKNAVAEWYARYAIRFRWGPD